MPRMRGQVYRQNRNDPLSVETNTDGLKKTAQSLKHFQSCEGWSHLRGILECHGEPVDQRSLQIQTVRENTKVIGRSNDWRTLAFKESLAIKERQPALNNGIKAAKELCLF